MTVHTAFASRCLALAALLASSGCASSGTRPVGDPFNADPGARQEVQLRVRNFNFADATVWVMAREGRRQRLGVVTGKTDAVFTVPWAFSEPMQVEFDLLAGVRCVTESMTVDPGDLLELQISVDPDSDARCVRR